MAIERCRSKRFIIYELLRLVLAYPTFRHASRDKNRNDWHTFHYDVLRSILSLSNGQHVYLDRHLVHCSDATIAWIHRTSGRHRKGWSLALKQIRYLSIRVHMTPSCRARAHSKDRARLVGVFL
jgi:hypothetical protein